MSPTDSPRLKAAEELELGDDDGSENGNDAFQDLPISPAGPSTSSSPIKSSDSPNKPALASSSTTPSKVKAAAAMWGKTDNTSPSRVKGVSPSSSFRSIPASSARTSPQKRSPEKLPAPSTPRVQLASPPQLDDTPQAGSRNEDFADVPLSVGEEVSLEPVPINQASSYSLSPIHPSGDVYASLPEPVVTPPAKEEVRKAGGSFFTSALGFGTSPAPTTGSSTVTPVASTPPSRSVSTSSQVNTGWRSTMSNLFVSRSASVTSPNLESASPAEMTPMTGTSTSSAQPGPSRQQSATSAAFILNRMSSTTASRDRRASKELGGGDKLREGFEKVRSEMEGAAREMRRERQATAEGTGTGERSPDTPGENTIDWTFWGAVVQDYEQVAVSQPKDLSKAIQNGIPPVIR